MDPRYPTIPDVLEAYNAALLTKPEARACVLAMLPAAKNIADAQRALDEDKQP